MKSTIYLIESYIEGFTLYKIGYTRSMTAKHRIKQLQTGNPSTLSIVDEFHTEHGMKVERTLHRQFAGFNIRDEWYDMPVESIKEFQGICQKIEDNLNIIKNNSLNS